MPARQIATNAGMDGLIVAGRLTGQGDLNFGFDAQTGEFGDLVRVGIVDPAKVALLALQDAGSVAGLLITTEAMATLPEPKSPAASPRMGGMDF